VNEQPPRSHSVDAEEPGTSETGPAAPSVQAPASAEPRIRAALWSTIPTALATELGALGMMVAGALVGVAVGIVGAVLLHLALRRVAPGPAAVRAALLVGGPPLRYALLVVAVWFEWIVRGSGPVPALAGGVLLAFVVPMIGGVLASPRRALRRG
jgi:hypothetical protein